MKINWKLFLASIATCAVLALVAAGFALFLSWATSLVGVGAGIAVFFVVLALVVSFILSVEM